MSKKALYIIYFILSVLLFIGYLSSIYIIIKIFPFHEKTFYYKLLLLLPVLFLVFSFNPLAKYFQKLINMTFHQHSIDKQEIINGLSGIMFQNIPDRDKIRLLIKLINKHFMIKTESLYRLTFNELLYEKIHSQNKDHPSFLNKEEIRALSKKFNNYLFLPRGEKPKFIFIPASLRPGHSLINDFYLIEKSLLEYYKNISLEEKLIEQLKFKKINRSFKYLHPLIDNTIKKLNLMIKIFNRPQKFKDTPYPDFGILITEFSKLMDKIK